MTSFIRATHNLADMLVLIRQGRYKTTKVAREGATRLGLDLDGMMAIVLDLSHSGFFYKTMESEKNPGHWMDVYHSVTPNDEDVYVKLMLQNGVLIVSFKELSP